VERYYRIQVKRFYLIMILLALAGWTVVITGSYYFNNTYLGGKTLCLIKNITGYPCPSCGVGRGIQCLTRLDLYCALLQNPLSLLVAAGGLIIPVWMVRDGFKKDISLYRVNVRTGKWLKKHPVIIILLILLILGNWIWNIYKF
jgi:hypothetical protein